MPRGGAFEPKGIVPLYTAQWVAPRPAGRRPPPPSPRLHGRGGRAAESHPYRQPLPSRFRQGGSSGAEYSCPLHGMLHSACGEAPAALGTASRCRRAHPRSARVPCGARANTGQDLLGLLDASSRAQGLRQNQLPDAHAVDVCRAPDVHEPAPVEKSRVNIPVLSSRGATAQSPSCR